MTELVSYPLDYTSQPFLNPVTAGICAVYMDFDAVPYINGNQIADGVYCRVFDADNPVGIAFHKKINIKTAGAWCNDCTFIADLIQASAADISMDPYLSVTPDGTTCTMPDNTCNGYPLFTYSPGLSKDGISFSGSGQQWDGVMFPPLGTTHYTGHDDGIYDGAIWSRIVQIIGSGFGLNGPSEWGISSPGGAASPEVLALTE